MDYHNGSTNTITYVTGKWLQSWIKVNVELSLCLPKHQAMKKGLVDIILTFLDKEW
jgi:hypothetical protein